MKPIQLIKATDKIIKVGGKVFHNDGRKRIDLKKPIRDLFENSGGKIGYAMELCLSETKAIERIKELSQKQVIPVILYFTAEKEEEYL